MSTGASTLARRRATSTALHRSLLAPMMRVKASKSLGFCGSLSAVAIVLSELGSHCWGCMMWATLLPTLVIAYPTLVLNAVLGAADR